MKKSMATVLVVSLMLVLGAQLAWAAADNCVMELVPAETRVQVEELRAAFKTRLSAWREELRALKATGDLEAMKDIKDAMFAAKLEIRSEIAQQLPEELREQFMSHSPQSKRTALRQAMQMRRAGR